MTHEHLDKIIEESPEAFASLLGDLAPKIIEAAKATLEESQDSESGKAVVKVGLSLAIDLCTSPVSWHVEASVGVRHKVKSEEHVADTSPELPGLEKKKGGGR
jgi:hypothetical protein